MLKQQRWLAVTVFVFGLLALSCGDDGDDDSSGQAIPGSSVGRFETGWVLSNRLPLGGGDVAANDDVVVAIGWEWEQAGNTVSIFYSDDGIEWEPGEGFPDVDDGPALAVAGGPSGFVAIGTRNGAVPNQPVIAFSSDGAVWDELDAQGLPESEVSWLSSVVAGPDGFVVVADAGQGAVVWFSTDGRTWVDTDLPAVNGQLTVATDGSDWMAVGGEFEFEDGDGTAVVFTSTDGLRWTEVENRAPLPAAAVPSYGGAAPLVADGDAWVLAPREGGPGAGTVWVSIDDGETWEQSVTGEQPWSVRDLAAVSQGFVIVGTQEPPPGSSEDHFLLFSEAGAEWRRIRSISEYASIASLGDDLVVLDTDGNIFVWSESSGSDSDPGT